MLFLAFFDDVIAKIDRVEIKNRVVSELNKLLNG